MPKFHLDTYRHHWEEYITPTSVYDSRSINWRCVPWRDLIGIRFHMKGTTHTFTPKGKGFRYFIRFRHGGVEHVKQGRDLVKQDIDTWVGGWSDGTTAYLKEINFKDGKIIKEYKLADKECIKHPALEKKSIFQWIAGA